MIAAHLYLTFCFILAYINYRVIKANLRVYHGINGALHLIFWIVVYFSVSWNVALALPFYGRVFFDLVLNRLRGLPADYVSPDPKSIVDKVENFIFEGNGLIPKVLWFLIGSAFLVTQ